MHSINIFGSGYACSCKQFRGAHEWFWGRTGNPHNGYSEGQDLPMLLLGESGNIFIHWEDVCILLMQKHRVVTVPIPRKGVCGHCVAKGMAATLTKLPCCMCIYMPPAIIIWLSQLHFCELWWTLCSFPCESLPRVDSKRIQRARAGRRGGLTPVALLAGPICLVPAETLHPRQSDGG